MLITWSEWYLCAASSWPGAQSGCISYSPKIDFHLRWSWGISGDMGTVPTAVEKALASYQEDEMFSDIYKIREVADGLCLEVEGKMVTRTEGQIDDSLIGGNASAEGPEGDGTEATVITGVDIVINHHLQETSFTKESYKKYIKDYMKAIKARLEEHKPERVKPFMTGAAEQIKHILANFKNYQFFVGENMNPDGMVALLDFREDGVTPYMIFFKDGLEIEKCVSTELKWVNVAKSMMSSFISCSPVSLLMLNSSCQFENFRFCLSTA
ncbi:Translationally-controlled tumor protein like protein [Turdus rufiventris]|nr:Translationally-controlled tumor protein like protein [Turdus rufiventris]